MSLRSKKIVDLTADSNASYLAEQLPCRRASVRQRWVRTYLRRIIAGSLAVSSIVLLTVGTAGAQGFSSGPTTQSSEPDSSRTFFWPSHQFNIPFDISTFGETPRAVQLEVSSDGGRSYRTAQVATAADREFNFDAPSDGLYLFRLIVIDQYGEAEPNSEPPMSVIVDTEKPEADLFVDVDQRGQLVADFSIRETNFAAERVQLEYRLEEDNNWTLAESELFNGDDVFEVRGTAVFEVPPTARRVLVRLRVRDRADNEREVMRFSQLPRTAMHGGGMQFASQALNQNPATGPRFHTKAGPRPVNQRSAVGQHATRFGQRQTSSGQTTQPVVDYRQLANRPWTNRQQFVSTDSAADGIQISGSQSNNQDVRNSAEEIYAQPARGSQSGQFQQRNYQFTQIESPDSRIQLGNDSSPLDRNAPAEDITQYRADRASGSNQVPTTDSAKRAYHSKSRLFELDYALDVDPSVQVAEVQLYATVDGGATWEKWGTDRDRRSPFEIEVQEEGLFGFRMVIVNARRQASNVPRDGDNADMWIYVDTTKPTVHIRSALYGKNDNRGKLIIEYLADDENLATQPIALSYAEKPDGPWIPIDSNLPNAGEYAWQTAPDLPRHVFLKIDAADMAGNISSYRLPQPVNIEGLTPRGRIQGFRPVVRP